MAAMPLKLNVSLSRKVGEANYGSRGATVGIETEVDSGLMNQPQQLKEQIACLFRLARQSVDRELNCHARGDSRCANQNVVIGAEGVQIRLATAAQVRAIHAIANRQKLDLAEELRSRFGVYRPDDLSLDEASHLIDVIKPDANGSINEK